MILFKEPKDQKDFRYIDARLMFIVNYSSELAWALEQEPLTITSVLRNDGSTHETARYRVIDWGMFKRIDNEWFRDHLNKKFPYGGRPGIQTIAPLNHGTAPHFHAQVRPLKRGELPEIAI